jgi:hypothetical protein
MATIPAARTQKTAITYLGNERSDAVSSLLFFIVPCSNTFGFRKEERDASVYLPGEP